MSETSASLQGKWPEPTEEAPGLEQLALHVHGRVHLCRQLEYQTGLKTAPPGMPALWLGLES